MRERVHSIQRGQPPCMHVRAVDEGHANGGGGGGECCKRKAQARSHHIPASPLHSTSPHKHQRMLHTHTHTHTHTHPHPHPHTHTHTHTRAHTETPTDKHTRTQTHIGYTKTRETIKVSFFGFWETCKERFILLRASRSFAKTGFVWVVFPYVLQTFLHRGRPAADPQQ